MSESIGRVDSTESAQSRIAATLPTAVPDSFQVRIDPFSRQWIRDDQYYAPTAVSFRFELRLPPQVQLSAPEFIPTQAKA